MDKIETERDLIVLIDGLIKEIKRSPELSKFYAESLKRLQAFRVVLDNVETRIAIIGITSSGKSTLMNAVLGAELLPTRVGPSSSKQVICGWDDRQEGEIIFDAESGKKPRIVKGNADAIRRELEKYGDEKFNPGNREMVDEIRVHAPGFRFNHDLVIIDTPGLDAYGLDQHKEVTMKLVLPTVDMILFLTNVKCDSDGANLEFIDNVTTDDKPLIIVQNKIDSIEAKYTREGIAKTVEEVKHDHLVRIQRLIGRAKKESVRRAPIVQVSARAASWTKSNLGELGKVLDEQIRLNSRFRVARRAQRLAGVIGEMSDALKPKLEQSRESESASLDQRKQLDRLQKSVDSVSTYWEKTEEDFKRRLQHISSAKDGLLAEIDRQYLKSGSSSTSFFGGLKSSAKKSYKEVSALSETIERMKRDFEEEAKEINSHFSATITETQKRIADCCQKLNLDESQISRSAPFRSKSVSISGYQTTREVSHTRRVKKGGLGCVSRFFGGIFGKKNWGYEIEKWTSTETAVDIGTMVQKIECAFEDFMSAFSQQFPVFAKNTETAVERFEDEMASRLAGFEEQNRQGVPLADGKRALSSLGSALENLKSDTIQSVEIKNAVVREKRESATVSEWECPSVLKFAAQFSHSASFEMSAKMTDWIRRRSGCGEVFVCGWNAAKLAQFRDWYFRATDRVQVVEFPLKGDVSIPQNALVFLLFNAEQTGSFKGKLFGSGKVTDMLKSVARSGKIVWVIDSVREHISGGAERDVLMEAFGEMLKIVREFLRGAPLFELMACERELYWSVLLHELYFNTDLYASETNRQRFVDGMSGLFRLSNERRHATGRYVAQFSNVRKEIEK